MRVCGFAENKLGTKWFEQLDDVLHFHVLYFHLLQFHVSYFHILLVGLSLSRPVFSCPAFYMPPLLSIKGQENTLLVPLKWLDVESTDELHVEDTGVSISCQLVVVKVLHEAGVHKARETWPGHQTHWAWLRWCARQLISRL